MRRVIHRLLSATPAIGGAYLAVWVAAFPKRAAAAYNNVSALLVSDARFFWLCLAVITAYAGLWWITSIEPKSRRRHIQIGLQPHYEAISRLLQRVEAAQVYEQVVEINPEFEAALTSAGAWIIENMGQAAFEKFKAPNPGTVTYTWPTENRAEAVQGRSNIIATNRGRLEVLDAFLQSDGWDGREISWYQRQLKRISAWKTKVASIGL